MKIGDKKTDCSWLSTDSAAYGDEAFGTVLSGKLRDFCQGTATGPGATLHSSNVAVAYTHLYGLDVEGVGANAAIVTRSGNQGSIAELRIPANAGLLGKAWNIVVGPELTWSSDATSTDFASEAEAVTTRNALKYYWEQEGVGAEAKAGAFEAMAMAEYAMHVPWDESLGKDAGIETIGEGDAARQRIVKTGDWRYCRIPTWDIIRDPNARSWRSLNWIIVREWPDRHDMAASCKTLEQAEACKSAQSEILSQTWMPFRNTYNPSTDDRIPVYYLYAKRTPAVPGGRQTVFLQDGTVLSDGPLDAAYVDLPPECIGPVAPLRAGEYAGTPWPYSKWMATLGAGQAADALFKDLLTNATAVSGNIISVEDDAMDSAMAVAVQSGGPQVVPRPKGTQPPQVLQLQQAHPEHFKLINTLRNEPQQIMGIDNLTAGQVLGENLSGAAMALMTSTSVQNNSQWQALWTKHVQNIGNITLRHIQHHLKVPKRIALAGNARSGLVTSTVVSGTDVQGIQRVFCTIGSAMQQTDAGKYTMMETALKNGWAKTPEQAQTVMDTGRYDALTEDQSNENLLIDQENEAIGRGEVPPVMLGDDHVLHIKRHRNPTQNLSARKSPNVVKAQQAHEDWHLRILRETDPALLQIYGQPSLGAPNVGTPKPPAGEKPPESPQEKAKQAGPSMPTNPATGEKAAPVAGTPPPQLAVKPGVA